MECIGVTYWDLWCVCNSRLWLHFYLSPDLHRRYNIPSLRLYTYTMITLKNKRKSHIKWLIGNPYRMSRKAFVSEVDYGLKLWMDFGPFSMNYLTSHYNYTFSWCYQESLPSAEAGKNCWLNKWIILYFSFYSFCFRDYLCLSLTSMSVMSAAFENLSSKLMSFGQSI